jgi:signal transduction histidine kinase
MGSAFASPVSAMPLESVISTQELNSRPARQPDPEAVTGALVRLGHTMAESPERVLQQLVDTALELCHAQSAGLSLLEEENGRKIFRWHGVAGESAPYRWGTTPREFSPCGTVLDTDQMQLMSQLDRHFTYFSQVRPRISEALLVPFHVAGEAVGTIWVISHDPARRFDAEDARVMATLGEFAAGAYQTVSALIALKAIVGTIRNPLLVLDSSLHVKLASQSYYETFQTAAATTEGRSLGELGNGQWDIPELRALLDEVLFKGTVVENFEVRRDFPSIGPRVMSLNARKLSPDGNPAVRILLAIEEITNRKRIEEELLRSYEDAQRFALVAAHDLRAPLNTAMMLLQLLDQKTGAKLEEDERRALSMATDNLERLKSLMGDILSYSQVGGSEVKVPVPLQEPLRMSLANLQEELEETRTEVSFGPLPTVKAYPSQLTLVFQNLISNAVKFRSGERPRIQIGATLESGETVVWVADNGPGFDPAYALQIFLPFKRLHGPETPGSGIGLASCKRIIERMGGRIWAEAKPGEGATFYFALPDS